MSEPIREAFTKELETADDDPKKLIREIMLSIITADSRYAGTDAKAYFQLGDKTFHLNNSAGVEVVGKVNEPESFMAHSSFELTVGEVSLSTDAIKTAQHLSAYSMSELPEGIVEVALSKIKHDEFEKGQTDVFFLKGKNGSLGITLEALRNSMLRLFHDKGGLTSDWHIFQIDLMVSYTEKDAYQYYKKWHAVGWLTDKAPEVLLQVNA
jgi:hypothetical protein